MSWSISVRTVGGAGGCVRRKDPPPGEGGDPEEDSKPAALPRTDSGDHTTFTVRVEPDDLISTLQSRIEDATGLAAERQRLIYRGRLIDAAKPAAATHAGGRIKDVAGLGDGQTIHLVPRPPTGADASHSAARDTAPASSSSSSPLSGDAGATLIAALLGLGNLASASPSAGAPDDDAEGGGSGDDAADIFGLGGTAIGSGTGTGTGSGSGGVAILSSLGRAGGRRARSASSSPRNRSFSSSSAREGGDSGSGSGGAAPSSSTRRQYRLTAEDVRRRRDADPGSLEPVRQGLLTLHTMLRGIGAGTRPGPGPGVGAISETPIGADAGADADAVADTDTDADLEASGAPAPAPARAWYRGQWLDCRDTVNQWLEATVVDVVDPDDVLAPSHAHGMAPPPTTTTTTQPSTTSSSSSRTAGILRSSSRRSATRGRWRRGLDEDIARWRRRRRKSDRSARRRRRSRRRRLATTYPVVGANDLEGRRALLLGPIPDSDSEFDDDNDGDYNDEYEYDSYGRNDHCVDGGDDDNGAASFASAPEGGGGGSNSGSGNDERPRSYDGVQLLLIHYNGWPHRWDEWIRSDSERLRPFRTRTRHSPAPRRREFYSGAGGNWRNGNNGGGGGEGHYSNPTPQHAFHAAPSTTFAGGRHGRIEEDDDDETEERARLVSEMGRVARSVLELLAVEAAELSDIVGTGRSAASASPPMSSRCSFSRRRRSLLPWFDPDSETPSSLHNELLPQTHPHNRIRGSTFVPSSRTARRDRLRSLAPLLDRLGRTLTDAAPHVAALAENLPSTPSLAESDEADDGGDDEVVCLTTLEDGCRRDAESESEEARADMADADRHDDGGGGSSGTAAAAAAAAATDASSPESPTRGLASRLFGLSGSAPIDISGGGSSDGVSSITPLLSVLDRPRPNDRWDDPDPSLSLGGGRRGRGRFGRGDSRWDEGLRVGGNDDAAAASSDEDEDEDEPDYIDFVNGMVNVGDAGGSLSGGRRSFEGGGSGSRFRGGGGTSRARGGGGMDDEDGGRGGLGGSLLAAYLAAVGLGSALNGGEDADGDGGGASTGGGVGVGLGSGGGSGGGGGARVIRLDGGGGGGGGSLGFGGGGGGGNGPGIDIHIHAVVTGPGMGGGIVGGGGGFPLGLLGLAGGGVMNAGNATAVRGGRSSAFASGSRPTSFSAAAAATTTEEDEEEMGLFSDLYTENPAPASWASPSSNAPPSFQSVSDGGNDSDDDDHSDENRLSAFFDFGTGVNSNNDSEHNENSGSNNNSSGSPNVSEEIIDGSTGTSEVFPPVDGPPHGDISAAAAVEVEVTTTEPAPAPTPIVDFLDLSEVESFEEEEGSATSREGVEGGSGDTVDSGAAGCGGEDGDRDGDGSASSVVLRHSAPSQSRPSPPRRIHSERGVSIGNGRLAGGSAAGGGGGHASIGRLFRRALGRRSSSR